MAYDIGKCNELIKASFPDRRLHIGIGHSIRVYSLVCLAAIVVSILGFFIFSDAINPIKFMTLGILAVAFLLVFALFNIKKLQYLYSLKDKNVLPALVPIEHIYDAKSLRGDTTSVVDYRWPIGNPKVISAEFAGQSGPLIVQTNEKNKQYALALCVDKKDKGKFVPYLMDKRLARCLLTSQERLRILRTIRKINKVTDE